MHPHWIRACHRPGKVTVVRSVFISVSPPPSSCLLRENVLQYAEDALPYEEFSIRLNNADLPTPREILRGITGTQYKRLVESLPRYRHAFLWDTSVGGRAFDYTVFSLRRCWLNLQALYVDSCASRIEL